MRERREVEPGGEVAQISTTVSDGAQDRGRDVPAAKVAKRLARRSHPAKAGGKGGGEKEAETNAGAFLGVLQQGCLVVS